MLIDPGQQIEHFRLDARLGEGGMGAVYQAYDLNLARKVALKIMRPELAKQPRFRDRFQQEAQAAARLDHSSIVRIYSFDSQGELLYLVMEYVSGPNLSAYLGLKQQQRQPINLGEVLHLTAQVAEALDYAHQQGIVHRDVKPDNLLLKPLAKPEREGEPALRVVVTDFGLAKLLEGGLQTQTGTFMGTLPYMSPEQCLGKPLDGRSDIYSLGVVLYQLATGRLPFEVNTPTEAVHKHVYEAPPPPRQLQPDVPERVERLILQSMDKETDLRFQSGAEMAQALRGTAASLSGAESTEWAAASVLAAAPGQPEATRLVPDEPAPGPGQSAFRQAATAESSPEFDQLQLVRGDEAPRTLALQTPVLTIGRGPDNDLILPGESISRRHARLERREEGWQVVDLNSANGTFLNQARLLPDLPQQWEAGAVLRIGSYFLRWQPAASETAATSLGTALGISETAGPSMAQSGLLLTVDPAQIELEAGSQASVQVTLLNQGSVVDHFRLAVEGLPADWLHLSEEEVQLMPGGRTTVLLMIQAPRESASTAGTLPFHIAAAPATNPQAAQRVACQLVVGRFESFSVDMRPQQIRHGSIARILVRNEGNAQGTYTLSGRDPAEAIHFAGTEQTLTVPPGDKRTADLVVRAKSRPFAGRKTMRPFSIQVRSDGEQRQMLSGQLEVPPLLPGWLLPVAGSLILLLCLGGAAALAYFNRDQLGSLFGGDTATPTSEIVLTEPATPTPVASATPEGTSVIAPPPTEASATATPSPTAAPSETPTPTITPTPTPDITSGLLAYYPFEGSPADASGNGNDGQRHREARCLAYGTDRIGFAERAAAFGLINCSANPPQNFGLIRVPHVNFTNNFTIAFWIYQSANNNDAWLLGQEEWARFSLNIAGANLLAFEFLGNNTLSIVDPEVVLRETWVFYVATVAFDDQGSVVSLYRDGRLVETTRVDGVAYSNPGAERGEFHIGASLVRRQDGRLDELNPRLTYKGMLDDLRIYDRPLNEGEIAALFGEG